MLNKNIYTIEQVANERWIYNFKEENKKGETLIVELSINRDSDYKNSLPKLWYKKGYTNKVLDDYISIDTYVTDSEGNCWGLYNPQHKLSEDGKRQILDFDWMLDNTEENKTKLLNEVYKIFMAQTGKTATEIKIEKIKKYASDNNVKIFEAIPEGWTIEKHCITNPIGSYLISNNKSFLSGDRAVGLIIA